MKSILTFLISFLIAATTIAQKMEVISDTPNEDVIIAENTSPSGGTAITGITNRVTGVGVEGQGLNSGIGVLGRTNNYIAVLGDASEGTGVSGQSDSGFGLRGSSMSGTGALFWGGGGIGIQILGVASQWGGGTDDCVIATDTSDSGSDMIMVSNDVFAIHLDDDNNSTSSFFINDGANNSILSLDESGDLTIKRIVELLGFDSQWGGGTDDCVIRTQQTDDGSDMIIVSNDAFAIHLDDDNNSTSTFFINNGVDDNILILDESGNLTITGTYSPSSDVNRKEEFMQIDVHEILDKVGSLQISEWQFKGENSRHLGPMAQDFHAAFGLGQNETTIATVDADGVALAAIQALKKENDALRTLVEDLARRLDKLEGK